MVNHHGRKKRLREAREALEAAVVATEAIADELASEPAEAPEEAEEPAEAPVVEQVEPVEGLTFPEPKPEI